MHGLRFLTTALAAAAIPLGACGAVPIDESDMTALQMVGNLQGLGLAYVDLTAVIKDLVEASKGRGVPNVQVFVDQFKKLTKLETGHTDVPQPTKPFSDLDQYFVLQAAFDLALLDKAFFEALIVAKDLFKPVAPVVKGLLQQQAEIIKFFLKVAEKVAPKTFDAINATDQSLLSTLDKAINAYSTGPFLVEEL